MILYPKVAKDSEIIIIIHLLPLSDVIVGTLSFWITLCPLEAVATVATSDSMPTGDLGA